MARRFQWMPFPLLLLYCSCCCPFMQRNLVVWVEYLIAILFHSSYADNPFERIDSKPYTIASGWHAILQQEEIYNDLCFVVAFHSAFLARISPNMKPSTTIFRSIRVFQTLRRKAWKGINSEIFNNAGLICPHQTSQQHRSLNCNQDRNKLLNLLISVALIFQL